MIDYQDISERIVFLKSIISHCPKCGRVPIIVGGVHKNQIEISYIVLCCDITTKSSSFDELIDNWDKLISGR